jgi:hypothetical protein
MRPISSAARRSVSREAVPLPMLIRSTWCLPPAGPAGAARRPSRGAVRAGRWWRVEQLAGGVDDGDLDAGAQAGIEAHGGVLAGRRSEQQVVQVGAEDADRFGFGALAQGVHQFQFEVQRGLDRARSSAPCRRATSAGRPGRRCRSGRRCGLRRGCCRWPGPRSSLSSTSASCSSPSLRPRKSASARCEGIARSLPSRRNSRGTWRLRFPCRRPRSSARPRALQGRRAARRAARRLRRSAPSGSGGRRRGRF